MTNVGEVTGSRDAEAGADPLGQRGLAGTERSDQHDQVARPEQLGQGDPEPVRVGRRRQDVLAPHVRVPATAVRSASEPGARGTVRAEPDRGRGVVGGPDRSAVDGVRPTAHLGEHGPRPEEPLRRREPERDDDRRVEQLQLAPQPPAAPGHLGRLRRPVARRAALHHVEDGGLRARQPGLGEQQVEQRAGPAHERPPGLVLRGARRLADQREPRAATDRHITDDDVLPGRGQLGTGDAGPGRGGEGRPVGCRGGDAGHLLGRRVQPGRTGSGHASTLTAGSAGPSAEPRRVGP